MLDLLIATLEMMGLTFVIGFFVAFIIKMIAFARRLIRLLQLTPERAASPATSAQTAPEGRTHDTGHPHGR